MPDLVIKKSEEIVLNAKTVGSQFFQSVSALDGGGFVAAWLDQYIGVKVQRFADDGTRIGAETLVAGTDAESLPSIAGLEGGGFAVTWEGGGSIGAQMFDASGAPAGSLFAPPVSPGGYQGQSDVFALATGGYAVTWVAPDAELNRSVIRAQLFDEAGAMVGAEMQVAGHNDTQQTFPVGVTLESGAFLIAWIDRTGSGGTGDNAYAYRAAAQMFAADGTPVGGNIVLAADMTNANGFLDIAALPGGGFAAVWLAHDGTFQARSRMFDADGNPVGPEQLASSAGDEAWEPTVTADASGGYFVAWNHSAGPGFFDQSVRGQLFGPDGNPLGTQVRIDSGSGDHGSRPDLATLESGNVVAVWRSDGDYDILARILDTPTIGTAGADEIQGTASGEGIAGLAGNDVIHGGHGNDVIDGGAGNDRIDGGAGRDQMAGGAGNDTYHVDSFADAIFEEEDGGTDRVFASVSTTLSAHVEHLTLTGTASINAVGNDLDNRLTGNDGDNVLNGQGGADTMTGGAGNDSYRVDHEGDVVREAAGEGTDSVESTISYSIAGKFIENLRLAGSADAYAIGNSYDNGIIGNSGHNLLNGGAGADRMEGSWGDDRYIVDNAGDRVIEGEGGGIDRVDSSVSFSLAGQHLETLVLTGNADIRGTGNSFNNLITGNGGGNLIDGRGGADRMEGGDGNDRYIVDHGGDMVVEAADGGGDVVEASVSFSLAGQYVETLRLTGNGDIDGTGNNQANSLIGNGGANELFGEGGDDRLSGGLGSDNLTGGAGADRFVFDSALGGGNVDEILDFAVADDTIYLDRSVFAVNSGALKADAFTGGTAAADSNDRIVYDSASGDIWYDADGSGAGAAVLFATVTAGTMLTSADFVGF